MVYEDMTDAQKVAQTVIDLRAWAIDVVLGDRGTSTDAAHVYIECSKVILSAHRTLKAEA